MGDTDTNDAADVIARLRTRLHEKIEAGTVPGPQSAGRPALSSPAGRELEQLLELVQSAHKRVGTINPRPAGLRNSLIQGFKKIMRRALSWYTRPLVDFQNSTIRYLYKTAQILDARQSRAAEIEKKVESLARTLDDLRRLLERPNPPMPPGAVDADGPEAARNRLQASPNTPPVDSRA